MKLVVQISRGQLKWFRTKARSSPDEIYAVLVGRVITPTKVVVTRFHYPDINDSAKGFVDPNLESCAEIEEEAKSDGLRVLGSIHSHPDWLPIMSPNDIRSHVENKDLISGIVEVSKGRTRVVFWRHDSSLPCELTYT